MSRFLDDAESLFKAASSAGASGPTDLAIVVSPGGAIRITEACGWDLSALQIDSGARTVYRVSRNTAGLRVEGRSGAQSCVLTAEPPALTARHLLNSGRREYSPSPGGLLLEAPRPACAESIISGANGGAPALTAYGLARNYQLQLADVL